MWLRNITAPRIRPPLLHGKKFNERKMRKIKDIFLSLIEKFLAFLRVQTIAAGLEVGDRVIRLVRFDGKVWQMQAIRLEANVMENGEIRDRGALIAALTALRAKAQ